MLEKYPDDVKLVHKNFPLSSHRLALPAAVAALAADRQGRYKDYHGALLAKYNVMSEEVIVKAARDLTLDMERFERDRRSPELRALVMRDLQEGNDAQVRGIPAVFINGRPARFNSPDELFALVDKALERTLKPGAQSQR